jgi:hypothetical protein
VALGPNCVGQVYRESGRLKDWGRSQTELCWSSLAGFRKIKGLGTLTDRIVLLKFSGRQVD